MISIIVPVKNEEKAIESLLICLSRLKGEKEILVVDGGSRDQTVMIAEKYCTVLTSSPCRGSQMHTGAMAASGDVLWFVHGDALVAEDSLREIDGALSQDRGVLGGCFSLGFHDTPSWGMKLLAWSSNCRARFLGLMFGDQGIFIRRDSYERLGGFAPMPIMEDWHLSRRLVKAGRHTVLKVPIGASGRRFTRRGLLPTLLHMHFIKLQYLAGVSPEIIAAGYREVR